MNWFKWVSRKELKAQLHDAKFRISELSSEANCLAESNVRLVSSLEAAEADLQAQRIDAIRLRGTVHKLKSERAGLRDKLRSCMARTKRVYK